MTAAQVEVVNLKRELADQGDSIADDKRLGILAFPQR